MIQIKGPVPLVIPDKAGFAEANAGRDPGSIVQETQATLVIYIDDKWTPARGPG